MTTAEKRGRPRDARSGRARAATGGDGAPHSPGAVSWWSRQARRQAIAGVQVQVISAALAIDRTVATESDGSYRFAGLPPGIYEIHATKTGFESEISKNLEVTLNRLVVYDITLQVGAVTQVCLGAVCQRLRLWGRRQ